MDDRAERQKKLWSSLIGQIYKANGQLLTSAVLLCEITNHVVFHHCSVGSIITVKCNCYSNFLEVTN